MRGSLGLATTDRLKLRIIPAHAGLTFRVNQGSTIIRDHPRACGAHISRFLTLLIFAGSSPRMRGSHIGILCFKLMVGIIPAHAGLTRRNRNAGLASRDHPRACGAHLYSVSLCKIFLGSSPRMRGSRRLLKLLSALCGIIPAHAGLTIPVTSNPIVLRDHPRACGAHVVLVILSVS